MGRVELTDESTFSIGGQVLNQRGYAATMVVSEALELELRVEADEALESLLLAVIPKVALAIAALLFRLAQGHDRVPIFRDWLLARLRRNRRHTRLLSCRVNHDEALIVARVGGRPGAFFRSIAALRR